MSTTASGEAEGLRDTALDDGTLHHRLSRTWGTRKGLWGWLTTVDHKLVARRYMVTAFFFLCLGGLSAVVMR